MAGQSAAHQNYIHLNLKKKKTNRTRSSITQLFSFLAFYFFNSYYLLTFKLITQISFFFLNFFKNCKYSNKQTNIAQYAE